MSSLKMLNQDSELARRDVALSMNVNAGKGMQEVLKTNLGPKGTLKMLVSGSGEVKITKDGKTLLHEMQIQNPTAAMIARAATAQDDVCGDGTTSAVVLIGELLKQAERYLQDGVHPRVMSEGFDLAKARAIEFLEKSRVERDVNDLEVLMQVAKSSLRTKVHQDLADHLADLIVNAVQCIRAGGDSIDLHMVEIMSMMHKSDMESLLVNGLVLDHGARHPDMKKKAEKCFILTCNVSLEYEKSEVNSGFFYSNAEQREQLVQAERKFTDDRVMKIVELKRKICTAGETLVVINQKGIDPLSLDILAKEGIIGIRRAKRRNLERLTLACGGEPVNSVDGLTKESCGWADKVHEVTLGEEKYTFVEGCKDAKSCTLLIRGPSKHCIDQIKDAVRDGLRSIKNAIEDKYLLLGAGSFEAAAHADLHEYAKSVSGKARLGVIAFADALSILPKIIAENCGFDGNEVFIKLQEAHANGFPAGIDVSTGDPADPEALGVYDTYRVKRQMIVSSGVIAAQLLLVDEIMKAGHGQK